MSVGKAVAVIVLDSLLVFVQDKEHRATGPHFEAQAHQFVGVVGIRLYIMRIKKMLYKNTGKLFCHKEA
jgi:hypothetical protein